MKNAGERRLTRTMILNHRPGTVGSDVLTWSRRGQCWVAVLGPEHAVHYLPPEGGRTVWVGRRPGALEPICTGPSLTSVHLEARRCYDARRAEIRDCISERLVQLTDEHE